MAALISAGDADSLAAASLLGNWLKDGEARRLELMARASEEAPERPDLAWLYLQSCTQVKSCDPESIEKRLRALDPANGAAWMGSLARSSDVKDPVQARDSLLAVAKSERFNVYWNRIIVNATNAIAKTQTMDTSNALVAVLGMTSAQAIPAYGRLSSACKGPSLEEADILDACRRVSTVLRRGDTYITELIGIAVGKRVWLEGSPEYQNAVEARRTAHYRMDTALKISLRQRWDEARANRYLRLLSEYETEQEVVLAEITNAGVSPIPTADWKDSWEAVQAK
jgi:hypothetical protein